MNKLASVPKVIIACDFNNRDELFNFLERFPRQEKLFLKLGMEIIYTLGFGIINELKNLGHAIFLDLKLHDIPVTLVKTLQTLDRYEIDFLTIHLTSGNESLKLLSQVIPNLSMELLGVSVLTSLDNNDLQMMFQNPELSSTSLVLNLAKMAAQNNWFGIICSPQETAVVKKNYPNLKLVTPGIQLTTSLETDQKRVATPSQAREWGSDYLVVGRIITQDQNPFVIYQKVLNEFATKGQYETSN